MRRLAGILAIAMVLTMVWVPASVFAEVETDPTKVSMSENFVAFSEDFSDNSNGWVLTGPANIKDGKLYLSESDSTVEDGNGVASLVLPLYETSGNWYITFKVHSQSPIELTQGTRTQNIWYGQIAAGKNQSGRLYWNMRRGGVMVTSEGQTPEAAKGTYSGSFSDRVIDGWDPDVPLEYMFAHRPITLSDGKTYDCYDVYFRELDENGDPVTAWGKFNNQREAYWNSGSTSPAGAVFHFGSAAATNPGATTVIDDIRIYQGAFLEIDEPVVENGSVTIDGEYQYGFDGIGTDRRLTQLTAVYDKEYGYTKKIEKASYTATGGSWIDLSQTVTDVNEETDTVAAMVWDDTESGIPLIEAQDQVKRNTAKEGQVEDETISVEYGTNFNEVNLAGFIGVGNKQLTASLTEKATGNLAAVVQAGSNGVGLVETKLGIDPAQWASGTYLLRIQTGDAVAEVQEVELYTNDILGSGITSADAMENFLLNYASQEIKEEAAGEGFAEKAFEIYQELAGENAGATDLYAFREYLDPALKMTIDERALLEAINREINASIVVWGTVRNLITDTYAETLGLTETDLNKINAITDQKALFSAFSGEYTSKTTLLNDVRTKVDELLAIQSATAGGGSVGGGSVGGGSVGGGSYGGAGGGAGGGGNYLSGSDVGATEDATTSKPPTPVNQVVETFTDLGSVSWAKDSILALQSLGIVNGEGEGIFAPNRAVTREEFLKMAMQAVGVAPGGNATAFTDVDANEWYYGYVAAAYEKGIINGKDETTFGIGEEITRGDMAVILKRLLDYAKVDLTPTENAYVFDDYKTIPNYARESITTLCQVGLMNGVGENRFDAPASATRAESAVAIHRVFEYIAERR